MTLRVVITGIGMVTPVGNSTDATWQGLLAGTSGTGPLPASWNLTSDYPVKAVGCVVGEEHLLAAALPAKYHARTDRFIHLTMIAAHEAMQQAGLTAENPADRTRIGAYVGVGLGGLSGIEEGVRAFDVSGIRRVSPVIIPKVISSLAPGWLSIQWQLQGPTLATASACASSTDALGLAMRAIRHGYADVMLAGGAEACITPMCIGGFGNMRALSTWAGDPAAASRPFDAQRTGFVLAEGATMLILEREDHARARGASIIAEISGYGATADAHHVTAMHPEADGAVRAMQVALRDARLGPEDIGYINAHGTGTPMNDPCETLAIKKVFMRDDARILRDGASHLLRTSAVRGGSAEIINGARPEEPGEAQRAKTGVSKDSSGLSTMPLVSSTKSMTGHMLGAAGATEAAICALALRDQRVPPTINLTTPDPACDLDYVPGVVRGHSFSHAMTNSFGFGGANAVLVVSKV